MGTITRPMLLGPYEDGLPCTVALSQQHVFIVGATGSGKSVLLNVALSELAAAGDVVCWGIDFKGGAELGPWQHCLGRIATTPAQAEQLLQAAVAVLEARATRGQRHWPTSPHWPELKIVIDEHAELVRHSKQAIQLEESIANRGRSVGVSLIVTSVRATQEALGSEQLRQQLRVRICMSLEDPKDADLVFGHGAARHGWDPQLLDAPGKFFLRARSQGLAVPKLARAFFVADDLAHQLAATYAHQATGLDALSQQAADRYPPPPATAAPSAPPVSPPPSWIPPPSPPGPSGAGGHDPAARLLDALDAIGPQGARVLELAQRTGQPGPGELLTRGKRDGTGLSPRTVKGVRITLNAALASAYPRLLPRPVQVKRIAVAKRAPTVYTPAQIKTFLQVALQDRLAALWALAVTSALRPSELLGLGWDAVDLDGGTIAIWQKQIKVGTRAVLADGTKTEDSAALIALAPWVVDLLRGWHKQQVEERQLWPGPTEDHNLVFTKPNGAALKPDWANRHFQKLATQAGLPRIRLYDLRHGWATAALRAGLHPRLVQEVMRHSDYRTTAETYTHVMPTQSAETVRAVAALFEPLNAASPEPPGDDQRSEQDNPAAIVEEAVEHLIQPIQGVRDARCGVPGGWPGSCHGYELLWLWGLRVVLAG